LNLEVRTNLSGYIFNEYVSLLFSTVTVLDLSTKCTDADEVSINRWIILIINHFTNRLQSINRCSPISYAINSSCQTRTIRHSWWLPWMGQI